MRTLFRQLGTVAARVAEEKGLYFFAAVHPTEGLHDRWDLLVSSPGLEPWSMRALKYIGGLLQEILKVDEIVRISRIVVLPRDNKVLASLLANDQVRAGRLAALADEQFDRVFLLYPEVRGPEAALAAGSRRHETSLKSRA